MLVSGVQQSESVLHIPYIHSFVDSNVELGLTLVAGTCRDHMKVTTMLLPSWLKASA